MHLIVQPPASGLERQRMVKVGDFTDGNWQQDFIVTGWGPDLDAPAVIASNRLQVAGSGSALVVASLVYRNNFGSGSAPVQLRHNDTIIRSELLIGNADGYGSVVWSVPVDLAQYDALSLWGSATDRPTYILASTYVEVAPV